MAFDLGMSSGRMRPTHARNDTAEA